MITENVLLGKNLTELQDIVLQLGVPKYVGKQLSEWLYLKRVTSFSQMTNISLKVREQLEAQYTIGRCVPIQERTSSDGTNKYLFPIADQYIETVYIPSDGDRNTLCVSSQIGCKMGCEFCMTGKLGFHGHLTTSDILNQIFSVPHSSELTNLVYMGEGEPMDNIEVVLKSIDILTTICGWSPHRITVSSAGYLKGLPAFLQQSQCHLAISLHNPFPRERVLMMPIERTNPIQEVIKLLTHYDFQHQRRLSFEYIMLQDNMSLRHAKGVFELLRELIPCRVNLIRHHQVGEHIDEVDASTIQAFCEYLTKRGIITTIRVSRGEDIMAACGMLVSERKK